MALYLLLGLVVLGCARGFARWREGLFFIVVIGAVQDPLRKLVPGVPGYLVLASILVLGVVVVVLASRTRTWWSAFTHCFPSIGRATGWFALACVPAAVISASYGPGSWMLSLLGGLSYSVLFGAVLVGFHFPRSVLDLRRFLSFYCVVTSMMLTGATMQYLGLWPDSPLLGTGALGTEWVRYRSGFVVEMIAGFYRSPDVMGWHAAATVMLATILALTVRGRARWFWAGLAALAVAALLLSARRKMVYMPVVFGVAVLWMYWQGRRSGRIVPVLLGLLAPLAVGAIVSNWLGIGEDSAVIRYYTEGSGEALDQLEAHGFRSLLETYDQAGFFGAGLGVATPGSHHLNVARPRTWQESGPSRLLVELGVPGLVAFGALVGTILLAAWRVTRRHLRARSELSTYAVGLLAFFLANAASLIVSGQILADPVVATLLGLSVGFVLALARAPAAPPVRASLPLPAARAPSAFVA